MPTEKQFVSVKRKIFRHPAAVLASASAMYVCVCLVGTKTLWNGYYLWQTPSLLAGALGGSAVAALLGSISFIARGTSPRKGYWEHFKHSLFRDGLVTEIFLTVAVVVGGIYLLIPYPPSPFLQLFADLEGPQSTYSQLKPKIDRLSHLPRFAADPSFRLINYVIEYRKNKQWSPDEYTDWANVFANYSSDPDPQRRGWALILAGEAFDDLEEKPEAKAMYEKAAGDESLRPFVRRKALQDLGDYAYFQGDQGSAVQDWSASQKIQETVGIDENLATVYADQPQWRKALDEMDRGRVLLDGVKDMDTFELNELKTEHAVQTANLLRRYARVLPPTEAKMQRDTARKDISVAHDLDPGFMDQYWVGALLSLDERDEVSLATVMRQFSGALRDPKLEKNRYRYLDVAPPYMLWLEIRGSLMNSSKVPQTLLARLDRVGVQGSSRPEKVYRILKDVEDSGVTVDEDIEGLFKVINSLR